MMSDESSEECSSEYILIPFFEMSGDISDSKKVDSNPIDKSPYKLVNGCPANGCPDSDLRIRKSYVMSYNNKTKNADWVYEILNKDTLKVNCKTHGSFGKNEFEDKKYEQGHLAAAANHTWCQEAYNDTFLMSNMVPQENDLNNGDWKVIENYCREKAINDEVCNVHVYTGPLYLEGKKNDRADLSTLEKQAGKIPPTHFFKVIIVENKGSVKLPECFVMPKVDKEGTFSTNNKEREARLNKYFQEIDTIEIFSGLKFTEKHSNLVMKDCIKTITGEGKTGERGCSAKIKVRISEKNDDTRTGPV